MSTIVKWGLAALAIALLPLPAGAQADSTLPVPKVGPAIQKIMTASAVSKEPLGFVTNVHELRDGRVLVNDVMRRRLLLFDTTLTVERVVLDSLSSVAHTYGTRAGGLIPYAGDSILFVDAAALAMLVLDPGANLVRVRSVWRAEHAMQVSGFGSSGARADAKGRIVYRVPAQPAPPKVAPPAGIPWIPAQPDSAFVVAVDLATRKADTLTSIRTARFEMSVRRLPEGGFTFDQILDPTPLMDDWAVLPDGRVAIVRGRDYRVEYLEPDGTWRSSAKLPYDWQRLTDEDKQRLADSVMTFANKQNMTEYVNQMIRWVNQYAKDYPANFTVPEGYVPQPGFQKDWIMPKGVTLPATYMYACPPGVTPTAPGMPMVQVAASPAAAGATPAQPAQPPCVPAPISFSMGGSPPQPTLRRTQVLPLAELRDYRQPFMPGVRADMEGNLWIRTVPTMTVPGGPVYDVVSPEGVLITRLQLPQNYTLVGFGKGRVVYLTMRDPTGLHLARVRLK